MATPSGQPGSDVSSPVREAVERGDWLEVVHLMATRQLTWQQRRWVVDKASELCRDQNCLRPLVTLCDGDMLGSILGRMVTRGMWSVVGEVLQQGVDDTQHSWAVEEASEHADDWQLTTYILPHCSSHQLDSMISRLISQGLWNDACKLVRCVGDASRTWTIDDMFVDNGLLTTTAGGRWDELSAMLHDGITGEQHRWAILEACKRAGQSDIVSGVLPLCAEDELDCVLTALVERGLWGAVGELIRRGVGDSHQLDWAICEAGKRGTEWEITQSVLPYCADAQLDSVKTELFKRGLWGAVGEVLQRNVRDSLNTGILAQAIEQAGDRACSTHIIPNCTNDQLDLCLTHFVSQNQWKSVQKLLRLVGDEKETWKVGETHVDSGLLQLVAEGRWHEYGVLLQRGVSDSQHRWAIDMACEQASEYEITDYILPHCADNQLDSVLTSLVERGLWVAVGKVLQRGVSDSQHIWAIVKACEQAHDWEIRDYILCHCTDSQLDSVLTPLVEQGLWKAVGKVLERGLSGSKHRWAIDKACEHASDREITHYILPNCADNQLDSVLTRLVERGLWMAVGTVLERGVSDSQHRLVIDKACEQGSDREMTHCILSHCADNQLDSVLTHLVERGLWMAVGKVLERGVSDSQCKWVIDKACEQPSDRKMLHYVLPHCSDNQLDSVLTPLVERGLWVAVGMVLERGVSDSQHRWAIDKACEQASDWDITHHILRHYADSQLDSVLTPLVERGLWMAVGTVLGRGVSDSQRRWAIDKACEQASNSEITHFILPHCADNQLDSMLTTLVERGLWEAVGMLLKRGVSDSQHRWAIDKASEQDIKDYILPHCADNQLDSVLTPLVEGGLWKTVGTVLKRGVSDSHCKWVIDKACEHASDRQMLHHILPHCADNQLDSVLTPLVERGLWELVGKVLERGVSDSQRRRAIDKACEQASDSEITDYILPHCPDNQLDSVLTPLVERGLWNTVGKVLERGASDSQHRWAIDKACEQASDWDIKHYILPHCADNQLDSVLTPLVERGMWVDVGKVLERGVSDSKHRCAIDKACEQASDWDIIHYILPHCTGNRRVYVLTPLVERGRWEAAATLLCRVVDDALFKWAVVVGNTEPDDAAFWTMVRNPCHGVRDLRALREVVRCRRSDMDLSKRLGGFSPELCEVLAESTMERVFEALFSWQERNLEHTSSSDPLVLIYQLHSEISLRIETCTYMPYSVLRKLLPCIRPMCAEFSETTKYGDRTDPFFALHFIKFLIKHYYTRRRWSASAEAILVTLTTVPVVPDVQSVALRVMLRHQKWDVIEYACLSHVWELVRRQLFQAAVEQRRWGVVKRWADHTLYDDQRTWALDEAFKEKQWDIFMLLADHGLLESELMRVHYRLVKHADWATVLRLFERGAHVREMKELLAGAKTRRAAHNENDDLKRRQRLCQLVGLEMDLKVRRMEVKTLRKAAEQGNWRLVLFSVHQGPSEDLARRALKAAAAHDAWHVVVQLVRFGTGAAHRDSLFPTMVNRRQWGVCMALLEQGVSEERCLAALPELMRLSQWTLVTRMMDSNVDDGVRRQVMQRAMERREGTLVWQCVLTMNGDRLSEGEREELFQQALGREVLQAIKPLIGDKDSSAIRRRDTVLLEAIVQHQWDVVDHCQCHHADINVQDAWGDTPMHRAANEGDWEAVKALARRDGDSSLLDSCGVSVLHRAIRAKQWDTVKLLIQFHGDIHQAADLRCVLVRRGVTPLQLLIDARQGEIIENTLPWCPDQWKGVNDTGETTLHAVCLSGWPNTLYYLLARGVNPRAVTQRGHSALAYAVLCGKCPQKMVAECVTLGLCALQPRITDTEHEQGDGLWLSPLVLAVMRGLPVVTKMLYESGSCSNTELFRLQAQLVVVVYAEPSEDPALCRMFLSIIRADELRGCVKKPVAPSAVLSSARYVLEVSATPRSLQSACRLVISRCVNVRRQRHRDGVYSQLLLPQSLKNYVMFSDLTDPGYGQHETDGGEEHI